MTSYAINKILEGQPSIGEVVTIKGWVRTRRDSKAGISFINVHDGSCFDPIQIVVPNTLSNYEAEILKLTAGCAITATGEVVESQGKGQQYEIQAQSIDVIGWVDDPDTYPIQPKRHTLEYLREVAHLRPRTNTFGAVTRVRQSVIQAIHRYFYERDFYWLPTPIITTSDCEGAGELFRVSSLDLANPPLTEANAIDFGKDFFGKEAFLTVSGQLNAEAYALALSKVYTFGPTFRAENSNTSRHLAEFWMLEPEMAFADLNDTIELSEDLLKYIFKAVLEERPDDMAFFEKYINKECLSRLKHMINTDFARLDYGDAIIALEKSGRKFEYPVHWGVDLHSEHERYLSEEHLGTPVVVSNYPKDVKAFYMRLNDDGETVAAMDVLAPGVGEIVGGSQREERLTVLDKRLDEFHLPKENYNWYRDLRRYGSVPHSGFGVGFERLLCYITGLSNIRDAIPFPRTPKSAAY